LSEIIINSEQEFDKVMEENAGVVLVLFTAPSWCVPCRQFEPHWNKAQDVASLSNFVFARVDMGKTPEDTGAHWASQRFHVKGVPTLLRFSDNGAVYSTVKARAVVPLMMELTSG
jgi:thiol:disulfide interchange protein